MSLEDFILEDVNLEEAKEMYKLLNFSKICQISLKILPGINLSWAELVAFYVIVFSF